MRTTIRLDDDLLRQAKRLAVESGRTLTGLIEDAPRERLARRARGPWSDRVTLPTVPGWGLRPGVDLDNAAALPDLLEEPDAASGR